MGNKKQIRSALGKLRSSIPDFKCPREGCFDCCGPVFMVKAEYLEIKRLIRARSKLWLEQQRRPLAPDKDGVVPLTCPLLSRFGKCMVYEARPIACRMVGSYYKLTCPHSVAATMSEEEQKKVLHQAHPELISYAKAVRFFDLRRLVYPGIRIVEDRPELLVAPKESEKQEDPEEHPEAQS